MNDIFSTTQKLAQTSIDLNALWEAFLRSKNSNAEAALSDTIADYSSRYDRLLENCVVAGLISELDVLEHVKRETERQRQIARTKVAKRVLPRLERALHQFGDFLAKREAAKAEIIGGFTRTVAW